MNKESVWGKHDTNELQLINELGEYYKIFLDNGKTERECIRESVVMAEKAGYEELSEFISSGGKIVAGTKVYSINMNKEICLFHFGEQPLSDGLNILGAHIDSPRLDIKSNPLYEVDGNAYFDTHYYGGIKKYQWVTHPMAIHGIVVTKSGELKSICIGDNFSDPVFCFTDLLVHLAQKQMNEKMSNIIPGEKLDLLIANKPLTESSLIENEKEAVKANVIKILTDKYGIAEDDFVSAELEIVPAGKARDCGLDRSMILSYGQDDRICAYTALKAITEKKNVPVRTSCLILADKEEVGSFGATGMNSMFLENTLADIFATFNENDSCYKACRTLSKSRMLSLDVSAAFDPLYSDVYDKRNSAFMSYGICFNKFTGSRGKYGANDSNPEYIAWLRHILEDAGIAYQFCEMGKVDAGGGTTISHTMAKYGMEVIDCGVPVLCMHAPYEVTSKVDLYEMYKGEIVFLQTK